jgi:hypothetical protein
MNVDRLHAIALAVKNDLAANKIIQSFQRLTSALQDVVNQPSHPQYQSQFSEAWQRLSSSLEKSSVNSFNPVWRQVLEEIGVWDLLGIRLEARVEEIFSRNQITQAVALQELQNLQASLENISASLDSLLGAFRQFHISHEELASGECEIGVLIPRSFVRNRLDEFGDELEELDRILGVFAELVEGNRPGFQVRAIASSDLSVFLAAAPGTCACIAFAIEKIISNYKSLLEIRKIQGDLKATGVPDTALAPLREHASGVMETAISALVKELFADFSRAGDKHRNNELATELRISLKKIATRVDRGFNFEVRIGELPAGEDENVEQGDEASRRSRAIIRGAADTMSFLRIEGDPLLTFEEKGPPEDVQ